MKIITHERYGLRPIIAVDISWEIVRNRLWEHSEAIKAHGLDINGCHANDLDYVHLDPGGMFNTKEPWKEFLIGNIPFKIQLSKLGWVVHKVLMAKKFYNENAMTFYLWDTRVIMSNRMWSRLIDKLESFENTDEALHAQITNEEIKQDLEAKNAIVRDIPREMPDVY